jgi:tetratricopeptide (TPR) repeat protein
MAFHKEGQAGRAILDYTTALWNENLPREFRPRTLNNRGLAFESINDFASAMRDYNLALRMNDRYAEAYCSRANLHRRFSRHELAIADYDMALRNDHPHPKYVFVWQGLALEGAGKRREAMDAFRRALSIDPEFTLARSHLERLEASQSLDSMLKRRKGGKSPSAPVVLTVVPGAQAATVSTEAQLNAAPWTPPEPKAPSIVKEPPPLPRENGLTLRPAVADPPAAGGLPVAAKEVREVPEPPAIKPASQKPAPAVAPEPAAPKAPANGEGGSDVGFALQLGSYNSQSLAESGWASVLKVAGDLLEGLSHAIEPAALPDRGTVYRLFAEALPDREAALGLCRTLRDKGVPCIVVRR